SSLALDGVAFPFAPYRRGGFLILRGSGIFSVAREERVTVHEYPLTSRARAARMPRHSPALRQPSYETVQEPRRVVAAAYLGRVKEFSDEADRNVRTTRSARRSHPGVVRSGDGRAGGPAGGQRGVDPPGGSVRQPPAGAGAHQPRWRATGVSGAGGGRAQRLGR